MKFKSKLFTIALFIIIILIFLFLISKREYATVIPKTPIGPIIRTSVAIPPPYVEVEIVGPYVFGPDALNYDNCQPWTDQTGTGMWIYDHEKYPNSLFTKVDGYIDESSVYKKSKYLGMERAKDTAGTNEYAQRLILYAKRNATFGFKAKPGKTHAYAWQGFAYTTDSNILSIKILTGNRYNNGKMKPFFIYRIRNFDGTGTGCISY
jgi:hypothetical protein